MKGTNGNKTLQLRRGPRVGKSKEGWEQQGTKKELQSVMYINQLPAMNVITGPLKKKKQLALNQV